MRTFVKLGGYISLIAVMVLGLVAPVSAASTCAASTPATAEEWHQLVVETPFNGRWYHGDAGRSVRLPDGRILWVFGDTLSGLMRPDGTQDWGNQFVHNRAVITDKGCVTHLMGPNQADGSPTDWIPIEKGTDIPGVNDYYWPGELFMDGTYLRMFLNHIEGNGNAFVSHGMDIATFDVSGQTPRLLNIKTTPATSDQQPAWGAAVVQSGSYTYIYGSINKRETWVFGHYQYLARVLKGQVTTKSAWRYWNGASWVTQQAAAIAVINGGEGIGAGTHVYMRPDGTYALVAKQHEYVGTELVAWTASALTGPWTKKEPALLSPVPNVGENENTYTGLAHPEITLPSGKLLVSWARSSWDGSQFGSPRYQLDFAAVDQP